MNFAELINSQAMKNYFGKRYESWKPELEAIIRKKSLEAADIDATASKNKIMQTIKFSWLGLLFTYFWVAYHNGKGWLAIVSIMSALSVIDILVLNAALPSAIFTIVPAVIFAMYGKSYILVAKAEEYSKSKELAPPSWLRVFLAIAILIVPTAAAVGLVFAAM